MWVTCRCDLRGPGPHRATGCRHAARIASERDARDESTPQACDSLRRVRLSPCFIPPRSRVTRDLWDQAEILECGKLLIRMNLAHWRAPVKLNRDCGRPTRSGVRNRQRRPVLAALPGLQPALRWRPVRGAPRSPPGGVSADINSRNTGSARALCYNLHGRCAGWAAAIPPVGRAAGEKPNGPAATAERRLAACGQARERSTWSDRHVFAGRAGDSR